MGKADCRALFSMPEGMAREAGPGAPRAARASPLLGGVFETPPPGQDGKEGQAGRPSRRPLWRGRADA